MYILNICWNCHYIKLDLICEKKTSSHCSQYQVETTNQNTEEGLRAVHQASVCADKNINMMCKLWGLKE